MDGCARKGDMRGFRLDTEEYFEVQDLEYLPRVVMYYPGCAATYDDPGDGSEIDISNVVRVFKDGHEVGVTTWGVFVLEYAADRKITLEHTERYIEGKLHVAADECYSGLMSDGPDYDDSDD